MPGEIYFNGRQWRQKGFSEQEVRFLELLWTRAGGAQEVTLNLNEVGDTITSIESGMRRYEAMIKRLEQRISELENEH